MEKVLLTGENLYQVHKYLHRPEWCLSDYSVCFTIKSVDFEKAIVVGERYGEEVGIFPLDNVELTNRDAVQLKYQQLLEKVPSEIRNDLEDVVSELEGYASARGYNGCF